MAVPASCIERKGFKPEPLSPYATKSHHRLIAPVGLFALFVAALMARADVNLGQRYPTPLRAGDTAPERARPWQFEGDDIFQLSGFTNRMADNLTIQIGAADLGLGHCADGVVWALVLPREKGRLSSPATKNEEGISHVWLRFHPALLNMLFPPQSVAGPGSTSLLPVMRAIAAHKFRSAFHAGENALIPGTNDVIVDVDTQERLRRFFVLDREKRTAAYAIAFEHQAFKPHPALTPALAEAAFDQIWDAFDSSYAMFIIRPEVDWNHLRDQWRPKALACQTSDDFAAACAGMRPAAMISAISPSSTGRARPIPIRRPTSTSSASFMWRAGCNGR